MVGSIGSLSSSIFQYQLSMPETSQTSQSMSFDELISNGKISSSETPETSAGVTASALGSSSSVSDSEMDLNKDGQVTADEVIRYMQMQMVEQMSEQMSSEDGSFEMGQQAYQHQSAGIDELKNKQAAAAYQLNQDSIVDMLNSSFVEA